MSKLKRNLVRAGFTLSSLLMGASTFAQSTTTPGVPTTAYGGEWVTNMILLGIGSALAVTGLVMYGKEKFNENA